MILKDRRWKKMREVFRRARFLEINNYPSDYRDCIKQAVRELVPEYELIDIYTLYGITYEEYIEDICRVYLRYKNQKISEQWQRIDLVK
jgi:hypothetical protein